MEKVTYFDVEYANSSNKAICQIGIMCENYKNGEPLFPEKNVYINPEDGFDDFCIKIHGISADKVKDEPNFPIVWNNIEKYFTNAVIIGHNVASADLDALVKALSRYDIPLPNFYYICTYELAKKFIPSYAVKDYKMSTLCEYFGIDIDTEHDAFDDACANADLFKALVEKFNIDVDNEVKKYIPSETYEFNTFVSSSVIKKAISEFYGVVKGFAIDNKITSEEISYLINWRENNRKYIDQVEISSIIKVLEKILSDNIVTKDEIELLENTIYKYLDRVSTSPITLSTQILDGILKGVIADKKISQEECLNLQQWLYDNIYLVNHFPFDKTMEILTKALADSVITSEESDFIQKSISDMLNPVESLREQIYSIVNKNICLSGCFEYGQKSDVEKLIIQNGGIVEPRVTKRTDILIVGNCECQEYSNGTYGTKVKKALDFNEKGCNIKIIKEADLFEHLNKN